MTPFPPERAATLVDVLDRVLDKGLVVAGDVMIWLGNAELLTMRIRLLVCSIDKAEQIGLNWWRFDPHLVRQERPAGALPAARDAAALARLEARLAALERALAPRGAAGAEGGPDSGGNGAAAPPAPRAAVV